MRAIDFFSGIGGMAFALGGSGSVVAAFDQNLKANEVYGRNHGLQPNPSNITSLSGTAIARQDAQIWLLGPPCQPFTVRGKQKDLRDPRNEGLLHLMDLLPALRPRFFFLENVMGFKGSRTRQRLVQVLSELGYCILEKSLCPTEIGIPNRRPRHYVLAGLEPLRAHVSARRFSWPLRHYLDDEPAPDLWLNDDRPIKRSEGMDVTDPTGTASCFARSYGRKHLQSGSYLLETGRLRFFSPEEIARLLHFPAHFTFPDGMSRRDRYKLVGNSVSVAVVNELMRHFNF